MEDGSELWLVLQIEINVSQEIETTHYVCLENATGHFSKPQEQICFVFLRNTER